MDNDGPLQSKASELHIVTHFVVVESIPKVDATNIKSRCDEVSKPNASAALLSSIHF